MRDLSLLRAGIRLSRWLRRRAAAGERGAIGVLVAVMLGAGVLFGMGALVVDLGELYQNRADLQSGADSGALAVAESCLRSTTGQCPVTVSSTALTYASANASGIDANRVAVYVCGSYDNGSLTVGSGMCPASTGRMTDCPALPPASVNYVDVYAYDSTAMPPVLARGLQGNSNYTGTKVGACARAEWGSPQLNPVMGLTISYCTWQNITNGGTSFPPPPPYTKPYPVATEEIISLTVPNATTTTNCGNLNGAGQFGWAGANCQVTVTYTTTTDPVTGATTTVATYPPDTGKSGNQCSSTLSAASPTASPVYIPVYSGVDANGNYILAGFAAFVVTGANTPAAKVKDWYTGTGYPNCPGTGSSGACVTGFFTAALIPPSAGGLGGGNFLGLGTAKLTG